MPIQHSLGGINEVQTRLGPENRKLARPDLAPINKKKKKKKEARCQARPSGQTQTRADLYLHVIFLCIFCFVKVKQHLQAGYQR